MKKVEERNEVQIVLSPAVIGRSRTHLTSNDKAWGDEMPIVRLGDQVGFVNRYGAVFNSIEGAFVASHDGCHCVANLNVLEAVNKIATFLVMVALKRRPVEIAKMMFHGEMFMFETFSSAMEARGLVEHDDCEQVEGYWPLELTDEGQAGLRMCLESEMVELPFALDKTNQQLLPEPELLISTLSKRSDEMEAEMTKRSMQSLTVFGLKKGMLKRSKDGKIRRADQALLHNL